MIFEDKFIQTYATGTVVFAQGSTGNQMYVVLSGAVEICRDDEGQRRRFAILGPGEMFGEMAIVDSGVRMASAFAVAENTQLVPIDQARFVYLTSQQPAFALTVMRAMAQRIRALGQPIEAN